ncbi:HD domain-containing phosphohydrolase [Hydrogenimonas sp.]
MEIENPLSEYTLLYVENEKEIRTYITPFLAPRVKTLWVAKNRKMALRIFEKYQPDIVLVDADMPKTDGVALAKIIRSENSEIPIVIMASYSNRHTLVDVVESRIDAVVPKPLKGVQLLRTLEDVARNDFSRRARSKVHATLAQHYLAIEEEGLIIYLDAKGIIRQINEAMILLLNYPIDILLGEPFEDLLDRDDGFNRYLSLFKAIEQRRSWHGEIEIMAQNDMKMTFKATMIPIRDIESPNLQFMLLLEDITELVNYRMLLKSELDETQKTLEEKLHFLKQYQNAINEGTAICRFDEEGTILKTDSRFDVMFGFNRNELSRRSFYELCGERGPILKSKIDCAHEGDNLLKFRIRCMDGAGREHISDSVFIPIYRKNGRIEEIISMHNDITELVSLNEEIKNTQKELLYILGEVAESRSEEMGYHVKRVAEYSRILGRLASLSEEDVEMLGIVAPMHDVGKIAIPDAILLKHGNLTEEEREIMNKHALIGGELFGKSEHPFMKAARIVAMEHHENYDGTGYPLGKRGTDIHIFGRIVAIADVFDALSMDRVYKKKWPLDEVIAFMKEQRGKKFDPYLIDIFLENLDLFLQVREKQKDIF